MKPIIVLLNRELRIGDNPLFIYAVSLDKPIIPVYIYYEEGLKWEHGSASKLWLKHCLEDLGTRLEDCGLTLITRKGDLLEEVKKLLEETGADEIVWGQSFEPEHIDSLNSLEEKFLKTKGIKFSQFNTSTLFNLDSIKNKSDEVYKVYTPFYKYCLSLVEEEVLNQFSSKLQSFKDFKNSLKKSNKDFDFSSLKNTKLDDSELELHNHSKWQDKILESWDISAQGAWNELQRFISDDVENYSEGRDNPSEKSTSRLSPYLHFGQISPLRIWKEILEAKKQDPSAKQSKITKDVKQSNGYDGYLRQLAWREFAIYILKNFPKSSDENLDEKFDKFKWADGRSYQREHYELKSNYTFPDQNKKLTSLEVWQRGLTGYPIVDAGMRELWQTGWMHNRVRMIVGSFLVKDLLIPWQEGAKWFWHTLFDADLANNSMGWQWVAGSGVDASPFFRIFNPILQGEKFDTDGDYVKKWCPELFKLDSKWIHKPFEAPSQILQSAGIELGVDYPKPIVNHQTARDEALERLKATKEY